MILSDMPPNGSPYDLGNVSRMHPKEFGEFLLGDATSRVKRPNLLDLVGRIYGVTMSLSSRSTFRVRFAAVPLSLPGARPALGVPIRHVVLMSAEEQVLAVATKRIIARMQNLKLQRIYAAENTVGDAMATVMTADGYGDSELSIAVSRPQSRPQPAVSVRPVTGSLVDAGNEAGQISAGKYRNGLTLLLSHADLLFRSLAALRAGWNLLAAHSPHILPAIAGECDEELAA